MLRGQVVGDSLVLLLGLPLLATRATGRRAAALRALGVRLARGVHRGHASGFSAQPSSLQERTTTFALAGGGWWWG